MVAFLIAAALTIVPSGESGVPLRLEGRVLDAAGHAVANAEVHAYETDATGWYTTDHSRMDEPHARLSGRVRTDAQGRFVILAIRPGHYPNPVQLAGRERHIPAHVHLDVLSEAHGERRVQAVFADDTLMTDPYWRDWAKKLGFPVLKPQPNGKGVRAEVTLTLPR